VLFLFVTCDVAYDSLLHVCICYNIYVPYVTCIAAWQPAGGGLFGLFGGAKPADSAKPAAKPAAKAPVRAAAPVQRGALRGTMRIGK
jgi:hypothetical protein